MYWSNFSWSNEDLKNLPAPQIELAPRPLTSYEYRKIALLNCELPPGFHTPEGLQVHHLDNNTQNKHPSNLLWVTPQQHSYIHGFDANFHYLGYAQGSTDLNEADLRTNIARIKSFNQRLNCPNLEKVPTSITVYSENQLLWPISTFYNIPTFIRYLMGFQDKILCTPEEWFISTQIYPNNNGELEFRGNTYKILYNHNYCVNHSPSPRLIINPAILLTDSFGEHYFPTIKLAAKYIHENFFPQFTISTLRSSLSDRTITAADGFVDFGEYSVKRIPRIPGTFKTDLTF